MSQRKFYVGKDIVGKLVVNQQSVILGKVKDTAYDTEGKMAIIVGKEGSADDQYVSVAEIKGIADVILLREEQPGATYASQPRPVAAPTPAPPPVPPQSMPAAAPAAGPRICRSCGFSNKPGSKFCLKCGSALG